MKVSKVTPVPIPEVVRIELSPDEATVLQFFCGRLSRAKIATAVAGDKPWSADQIMDVTSALFYGLRGALGDN